MSKSNMVKMFQELSYKHSLWEVYSDFLEMSAIVISNSLDIRNHRTREERYLEIVKKYTKEELAIFPKLLVELAHALEEKVSDVLGELFMEMELGGKWQGQFFTPYHVCLATAEISFQGVDKIIEEIGYITVNEPACGGGAMILAFAEIMKKHGYNPQEQMKVICNDLDLKAVHMSYIQLSLLGIPAMVYHMNTLSMEMFSEWKTPLWLLGGWTYKKPKKKEYKVKLETEENGQLKII